MYVGAHSDQKKVLSLHAAGVTGGYNKLPGGGAKNGTWVL